MKTEPISNVPFDMRLSQPSQPLAFGSLGSKSGAEAMASIAGVHVEDDGTGRLALIGLDRVGDDVVDDVLDAEVDRELHRLQRLVAGQAGRGEIGEALLVDIFLHAGDAVVVDIDIAEDMRGGAAAGIEAAHFRTEADGGNAEARISLCCFGVSWRSSQTKCDRLSESLR